MAKNPIDLVLDTAKKIKTIQMDELLKIKAAWDKFDLDGNGIVEIKEVDMFLKTLNKKIPESERKQIITLLDKNQNGKVEFVEMVRVYKQGVLTAYI